jgi:hypothetical protein
VVRETVTANDLVSPGARVRDDGEMVVSKPPMPATFALTVSELPLTLVSRRLTVWVPAKSPIAIEARLRSLGSIGVYAEQNEPGCTPQMKFSQSLKPESYTRPGSSALLGSTWPAPWRKISTGLVFGAGVPPSSTS